MSFKETLDGSYRICDRCGKQASAVGHHVALGWYWAHLPDLHTYHMCPECQKSAPKQVADLSAYMQIVNLGQGILK